MHEPPVAIEAMIRMHHSMRHVIHVVSRHYPMTTAAGHATVFTHSIAHSQFNGMLVLTIMLDGCIFYGELREAIRRERKEWHHGSTKGTTPRT